MTVKDLITKKDYDYISWRVTAPESLQKLGEDNIFFGCCKSENGKLIPLDGDIYDEDDEVLSYEEWNMPEESIENGLTVLVKGEWM